MSAIHTPTPEQIKSMRVAAGLTQRECADRFGYQLRGWQKKEESGPSSRSLSVGEWELLLLLANQHPELELQRRTR